MCVEFQVSGEIDTKIIVRFAGFKLCYGVCICDGIACVLW